MNGSDGSDFIRRLAAVVRVEAQRRSLSISSLRLFIRSTDTGPLLQLALSLSISLEIHPSRSMILEAVVRRPSSSSTSCLLRVETTTEEGITLRKGFLPGEKIYSPRGAASHSAWPLRTKEYTSCYYKVFRIRDCKSERVWNCLLFF